MTKHLLIVLGTTAVVALAQSLVSFDPSTITDWHEWATGIVAAVVRQLAAAIIANVTAEKA